MEFVLATIERKRLLVPIPFALAKFKASFLQYMPKPLLTPSTISWRRPASSAT
jgi:NADH dehydrogenase